MQHIIFQDHNWIWISILSLVFTSPVIAKLIELYTKKRANKRRIATRGSIQFHPFFDFMDYCLKVRIRQMNFGSEFKTNAFRDLLYIRLSAFRNNLKEYTIVCLASKTPAKVFHRRITQIFYETIDYSEIQWRKLDIPEIEYIIQKFSAWHSVSTDFILKYTTTVMNSDVYKNDYDRLNAILDIYTTAFEVIILDVESGLRKVNGKFKGLEYSSKIFNS